MLPPPPRCAARTRPSRSMMAQVTWSCRIMAFGRSCGWDGPSCTQNHRFVNEEDRGETGARNADALRPGRRRDKTLTRPVNHVKRGSPFGNGTGGAAGKPCRRSRRAWATRDEDGMQDERIAITAFREGEEGVIHAVNGGRGLTSRLAGMGVAQGARVRVTHNSGGWVILQVSDTRVALGRGEAAKILAAKLREAPEAPAPRRASRG
ncbi:MAG TPA: hypothetical protein DCS11_10270, partial [Syntrophus sp. (in: bacteria)]|nr:hypothetical protein [Syntrophus sp. (in: bacteria)]